MKGRVSLSARVYRALLRAYPAQFRRLHGPDMVESFIALKEDAVFKRGSHGVARFWMRELVLLMAHAMRIRVVTTARWIRSWFPGARPTPFHLQRSLRDINVIGALVQDLRYAVRALVKNPGFTTVVVLTLALAIGANTAIFSVVNGVLLRPLPYRSSEQLRFIWDGLDWIGIPRAWVQAAEVPDLRSGTTSFEGFAALRRYSTQLTGDGAPEQVRGASASANLFDLLGVAPLLGRTFTAGDDVPGGEAIAILQYGFWQLRYGGDPNIVGQRITLGGTPTTVVGVLRPDFDFRIHSSLGSPGGADVWTPLQLDFSAQQRGNHSYAVLTRIKDGVSQEAARADLAALSERLDAEFYNDRGFAFRTVPVLGDLVKEVRPALLVLLGAVAFVLLIATANIATVMMARAQRRDREFAVRRSLGAGRGRLVRQLATETVVLSMIGAGLGLALAAWGVDSLLALAPDGLPRAGEIGVDLRVLSFTLFLALGTGLACGLAPAFQVSGIDLTASLREGGRGSTQSRKVHRARSALIAAEFGLSLMLLVGTGLLIRSYVLMQRVDPGFSAAGVLTMGVQLPSAKYPNAPDRITFYNTLLERVRALPGVAAAGANTALPLSAGASQTSAWRNQPTENQEPDVFVDWMIATPGYFESMGISVLAGRRFTVDDRAGGAPTVVIDESLARSLWPGEDATNQPLWFRGQFSTVVGVVRHARLYQIHADDRPQVYVPYEQLPTRSQSLSVRAAVDPATLASAVRSLVWELDPDQPVTRVQTMQARIGDSLGQRQFTVALMVGFGVAALLLAALGLYGVTAYTVSQRTHELGLRMALGAKAHDVLTLVFKQAGVTVGLGLGLGLAGALSLAQLLANMVFGVSPRDPWTILAVSAVLTVVAVLATYVPARRASRVAPMMALRQE